MISTIINIVCSSVLSLFAYQVNNVWVFVIFGWIVGLLSIACIISVLITGARMLFKRRWLLASFNFLMLIPLIYFSLPMIQIIGG